MWIRAAGLILLLAFTAMLPCGAEGQGELRETEQLPLPPGAPFRRLPRADDAMALALADLLAMAPYYRQFARYVWVKDGTVAGIRSLSLAINMVGRGLIERPVPLMAKTKSGCTVAVLRLNLRDYAPREKDLREVLETWEDFQFDPALNLLFTKDMIELASQKVPHWKGKGWVYEWGKERCPPFVHTDGKTYTARWVRRCSHREFTVGKLNLKDIDIIRFASPEQDTMRRAALEQLTGSQAPLITDDYLIFRALSTIKDVDRDNDTYAVVWGGRYFELAGIRTANAAQKKLKASDEDVLFEDLGLGSIKGQVRARDIYDRLGTSDRKVGMFRSKVTGKPRQVDFFRTLVGGIDDNASLISVTHDSKSKRVDIKTHAMFNLLDFKDDAREVIFQRASGLHGYALFDGKGVRQDEVPFDVANDRFIPAPHHLRLQSAISCIRCHETEGSDGWKEAPNQVLKYVNNRMRLDVFGDVGRAELKKPVDETVRRLAALYKGKPEQALRRGRDAYAAAVLLATGPWPGAAKTAQANVVKVATSELVRRYDDYWFKLVTPQQALRELGIETAPGDAVKTLKALLLPDLRAAVPVFELGLTIVPEDPRIGMLRAGESLPRSDWDLVRPFAAERAGHNLKLLAPKAN